MYETILVPYDGSKDAKKGGNHAVTLARELDASIIGLYVVKEGGNPWSSTSWEDQQDAAKEYAAGILEELAELANQEGVEYESEIVIGPSIHSEINDTAQEKDVDVIVMGSGYYGKYGSLLGSTAEKVLRGADVPVITVRREEDD